MEGTAIENNHPTPGLLFGLELGPLWDREPVVVFQGIGDVVIGA